MKKIEVFIFRGKEYATKEQAHQVRKEYLDSKAVFTPYQRLVPHTPAEMLLEYEHLLEEKITKETYYITSDNRRTINYKEAIRRELFLLFYHRAGLSAVTTSLVADLLIENKDQIIKILGD